MTKHKFIVAFCIWLVPLAFLCFLLNDLQYGSQELNEGNYIIKNGDIHWINQITNGVFKTSKIVNSKFNEELYLSGEDFSVKLGYKKNIGWVKKNGQQIHSCYGAHTVTPNICIPVELFKQKGKTTFIFYYEPLKLILQLNYSYKPKEALIHRTLSLTSQNDEELVVEDVNLGEWSIPEKITGGGKGLPAFINGTWFFSGEEPWVETSIQSNKLLIAHHPSAYIKYGETWISDSSVVGGGCVNAKKELKDYINTVILYPKFFSLYNTWYDLRDNELTFCNITNNFIQLNKKLNEFYANIDYCVIDDGWFFKDSLYDINTNLFSNGLKEVSDCITQYRSELGLWLAYSGLQLNNEDLKDCRFEEAHSKYFCLSGTNYFTALSHRLMDLIKNEHIRFFKHDFNYFGCTKPSHGHLRNIIHSEESNMRQTAKLLLLERQTNSEVIQAITTGINLSPWWLKYAHVLWMGGGDVDYDNRYPVINRSESEMTYRDGKLYEILKDKNMFFPIYALMTHGIIDGRLNSVGPWTDTKAWADYVMNYFGRGTAIREFYIYPPNLDKKKIEILARGLNWATKHNNLMLNSEMILGDPRKNEVYGFKGYDLDNHIYVSLRNPKLTDEVIAIKDVGITSDYYRISYPYNKVCDAKTFPRLNINAKSITILESLNLKDLKHPTIINSRAQNNLIIDDSNNVPVYQYLPKSGKVKQIHLSKDFLTDKVSIIEPIKIHDNNFSVELDVPQNANSEIIIVMLSRHNKLQIKNNNKNIIPYCVFSPESNYEIAMIKIECGKHTIEGNSVNLSNIKNIYLRTSYVLQPTEIGFNFENEDFTQPYPISQNVISETLILYNKNSITTY